MSKLLAILASLKAILIAASVAFARGDILPVILISILLNLAELGGSRLVTLSRQTSLWCRAALMIVADFECTQPSLW